MVLDKENDKVHPRYLAYDIIIFQVSFVLFFHDLNSSDEKIKKNFFCNLI